jgi:hypothetical protein
MAIIYSYPINTNILATDIIVGSSTVIVGGRPKNQTKSFKILDLTAYFASVLVPPGSYVPYTGAIGSVNLGVYSLTAGSIIKAGGTNLQFLMADGSVSTAPSLAGFVPYVGATQAVDLGAQDLYTTGQISTTDFVAGNDIYVGSLTSAIRVGRGPGNNSKSTVLGDLALSSVTTGDANTAIGVTALQVTTSGNGNTAIGAQVLIVNTTGALNTAVGSQALRNNLVGNRNTAIGNNSLTLNTADDNTAVGYNSLLSNTSGANNVAIGVDSLKTNTTGLRNTAIGTSALLASTTANDNVAIGSEALQSNTASNTVGVGYQSLKNNTGAENTALGYISLKTNTTGGQNTAVGRAALAGNTTGSSNTAIGRATLGANTIGINNVGIGVNALFANSTTSYNIGIGVNALLGPGNNGTIGIGYEAGANSPIGFNTNSFNSVFIGNQTKPAGNGETNQIVIGDVAVGAGSNTVTLGNTLITTTRLRGAVRGGSFVKDSGTSSQYLMADGTTTTAIKSTYMMTGVFTNMFGGDPGGNSKDVLEWVASTPNSSHSSALPILQNCRITAAGFKWISSTPIGTINPGDSWTVQVLKMTNPLTDSTTADGNFTFLGNLNITLTSANTGTTPGVFSSGLNVVLNAGDIIRIAGIETGTIAVSTEEAQLTVLFEVI